MGGGWGGGWGVHENVSSLAEVADGGVSGGGGGLAWARWVGGGVEEGGGGAGGLPTYQ